MADALESMPPPNAAFYEIDPDVRAKVAKIHATIRAGLLAVRLDGPSMRLIMAHIRAQSHAELLAMLEARPDLAEFCDKP